MPERAVDSKTTVHGCRKKLTPGQASKGAPAATRRRRTSSRAFEVRGLGLRVQSALQSYVFGIKLTAVGEHQTLWASLFKAPANRLTSMQHAFGSHVDRAAFKQVSESRSA